MARPLLAALMATLGMVGAGATLVASWQLLNAGQVSSSVMAVVIIAFGCFFLLLGLAAVEPRRPATGVGCRNCGGRLFPTLRSADRTEVLTCFACGLERTMPPLRVSEPGPRPSP